MSAKEPNTKHRIALSVVNSTPPEIWSQIFRHAVGEHIDEDRFFSSAALNDVDWERLKAFKRSLVTRRSLPRVCKAWLQISPPFLYEYLLLGRGRSIFPLRDAISASQRLAEDTGEGPWTAIGWWTRRLDVQMRDDATEKLNPYDILDAVADIVACLPNLQILTFSVNGRLYNSVKELPTEVLASCPKTLRAIHWHTSHFGYYLMPTIKDWTSFLENHSELESIRYQFWASVTPGTKIKLDSLKLLHSHSRKTWESLKTYDLMNFDLPAVRLAIFDDLNTTFFRQFGSQLTIIQIELRLFERFSFEILQKCPNLLQLDLIGRYIPDLCLPLKVKTLCIRFGEQISIDKNLRKLWGRPRHLSLVVAKNPALKVIQILDRASIRDVKNNPRTLGYGMWKLESLGLTILDNEGCPMKDLDAWKSMVN